MSKEKIYIPRIGLEIHAELKTVTKMFCACLNDSDEKHPNVNICPICTGHPGTLPTINKDAVKSVLRVGLALGGKLADDTRFDRKNYFYPDLPKGYQITQYQYPLVNGGVLNDVKITRVHLEEDTGRLQHADDGSLVDFNRAGVPLMELVTEPDIVSAAQARQFAEELRLVLRYLGVSEADMEKGQMRVEANVSVSRDPDKWGTKVEVKNLNSFKSVEAAIEYEIGRQSELLAGEGKIVQETRGWDDVKQKTFSQRLKEEAHDYRYFPEPDLPPLKISEVKDFQNLSETIPELPKEKRIRFKEEYGIKDEVISIFVNEKRLSDFFEAVVSEIRADLADIIEEDAIKITANYLVSDLTGLMKEKYLPIEELMVTPENFADLIVMIVKGELSSRAAKDVLRIMVETGAEPNALVLEKGLRQTSDTGAIEEIVKKILAEHPDAAKDYKNGKENALQFLLGMVMKETKGKSHPQIVSDTLTKLLG